MDNEERARNMGWVPKEEFRGDESRWVDADTFLDRGDNMMPILKERYNSLETRFEEQSKTLTELNSTIKSLVKMNKTASARAHKKAVEELKSKQRQAIETQDVDAYDRIDSQINNLQEELNVEVNAEPSGNDGINEDFPEWHKGNLWYNQDHDMTAYANGIGPEIAKEHPGLDGKAFYEKVTQKVKEVFPEKFENPKRKTPNPVEGSGSDGDYTPPGKKKTFSDLPGDAKEICKQQVKEGLFKDNQEYIDLYFEGE